MAYPDVISTHWAYSDIQKAYDYGLMEGYEDGRFGLGDNLTRASFTTMLCRMFQWETDLGAAQAYIDCTPDDWFYPYIQTAYETGALEQTVSFRPNDPISREEMAILLVRSLGYTQLAEAGYEFALPFSDVTAHRGSISVAS